jgi:hypothetical protein
VRSCDGDGGIAVTGTLKLEEGSDIVARFEHVDDLAPHGDAFGGFGVADDVHSVLRTTIKGVSGNCERMDILT